MADVAHMPGVWQQLKLIGGLRWHILRNGLRRKNNRWDLIGMIWAGFFSAVLVLSLCFVFYEGTYASLVKNHPQWIALLFWGLFVWWQVFPIFAAGFGANFEFKKLLRFPLSMRAFYLLGLGYGLADFAALSSIAWIISMLAGAMAARASVVPALLVVSALFVLLNVTIERLMGSWVEKILAKRRTRELFFGLFILSMVSLNFLSPMMQRYGRSAKPRIFEIIPYLWWTPAIADGKCSGGSGAWRFTGISAGPGGPAGLDCNHQRILVESIPGAIFWRRAGRKWRAQSGKETGVAWRRFERVAAIHFTASGGRGGEGVPVSDAEWLLRSSHSCCRRSW